MRYTPPGGILESCPKCNAKRTDMTNAGCEKCGHGPMYCTPKSERTPHAMLVQSA